jgi:hypothetical protein
LYWCSSKSLWKHTFHLAIETGVWLNIKSFRIFHMFQVAQAKTSKKQGPLNAAFAVIYCWFNWTESSQWILRNSQHWLAKSQQKKRCWAVSKELFMHNSQLKPESRCHCFLCIRSRVFSLSINNNHAKTFNLGRALEFQMSFRAASLGRLANRKCSFYSYYCSLVIEYPCVLFAYFTAN